MSTWTILLIATAAAYCDVKWRRVPNWLAFGFAALALASHALTGGLSGLGRSAAGLALPLVLLFPLFVVRGLGAGDVKFVAALGAALTYTHVPRLLLGTVFVAAGIALADVLRKRRVMRTANNLLHAYRGLPSIDSPDALLVPFTFASAVAAWWILLAPTVLR